MATEEILRQETLGVLKKKSIQNRFFVLYKDRLDYHTSEEELKPDQPRGRLSLNEVERLEAQEDGFTLMLLGGQSLTLKMSEGSLQQWLSTLRPLLKASAAGEAATAKIVHFGYLTVERKGKAISPFFVLRPDSLDRHESQADFEKGQAPRGQQLLSEIERFVVKDLRFVVEVRNQSKPFELRLDEDKALDFKEWTKAFHKVLFPSLGDNFVVAAGPPLAPSLPSDAGHTSASASSKTTPREAPPLLCEGYLMIQKKDREESRYCVLRSNSFEYFINEKEYRAGAAARCRALMEDITAFEVENDVMVVKLGDKSLQMRATSEEELSRWRTAWETDPEDAQATVSTPARPEEKVSEQLCCGRFYFRQGDVEAYQAASQEWLPAVSTGSKEERQLIWLEDGSFQELPAEHVRQSQIKAQLVTLVLRQDSLEIFEAGSSDPSADATGTPIKRLLVDEIEDLEVEEENNRFVIFLPKHWKFELSSPIGKSLDEWYTELTKVFEEIDSQVSRASIREAKDIEEEPDAEVASLARDLMQAVKTVNAMLKTQRVVKEKEVNNVPDLFKALDQADAGEIPPADFAEALKGLNIGLSQDQLDEMVLAMDMGNAGGITLPELEQVLQMDEKASVLVAKKVREKKAEKPEVQVQEKELRSISSVRFSDIDMNHDGVISKEEFEKFQSDLLAKAEPVARPLPGEMEDDILQQPSSPSRPARNRAIFSGAVDVDGEKRHGVLYPDRLAFFENAEDIVYADPVRTVSLRDMQSVKVTAGTFDIQAGTSLVRVRIRQDFEKWQSSLEEVVAPTFEKKGNRKMVEWVNLRPPIDSPVQLPKPGVTKPMHHGPLKVARDDGSEQVRYFLVYSDRFEYFADAASAQRGDEGDVVHAMDVKAVRVVEDAFIFELRDASLEVRVPVGEDMEIWVVAFQLLFHPQNEASQTPNNVDDVTRNILNRRSPFHKDVRLEKSKFDNTEIAGEVQDEHIQHWIQTLPEKVVHWGLLGFQHQQRLVVRLSILFKDRLDSWSSAQKASFGFKEDSRILMSSIRGVETVSGGLILNLGGKKVGIHVGDNEHLHHWSSALLSILAPNKAEHQSRDISSPENRRARSETPRATPRKGRDWVPEVAFKSTKSIQAGGQIRSAKMSQPRVTIVGRGAVDLGHLQKEQDLKRFCINTHKGASEALEVLHGKQGKFLAMSYHPGARRHVQSDISEKPYTRSESTSAISTRSTSREEALAGKVTGDERQFSPRHRGRADHSFGFWKINTEDAVGSARGSPSSQPPQGRARSRTPLDDRPLTAKIGSDMYQAVRKDHNSLSSSNGVVGKVGCTDRKPLQTPRRSKSQGTLVGKVTDAGREQNGWATSMGRVSLADKVKSMGK
ncbi:unnamed protein product [Effrenium voratum]|uniref:Calmodulin n=1 Tax=Effrenium voratum TaxID=2562239 RepID=A0AA36JEJ9_9DINO|nr:unnamed protein product [Effrenium voratum]